MIGPSSVFLLSFDPLCLCESYMHHAHWTARRISRNDSKDDRRRGDMQLHSQPTPRTCPARAIFPFVLREFHHCRRVPLSAAQLWRAHLVRPQSATLLRRFDLRPVATLASMPYFLYHRLKTLRDPYGGCPSLTGKMSVPRPTVGALSHAVHVQKNPGHHDGEDCCIGIT